MMKPYENAKYNAILISDSSIRSRFLLLLSSLFSFYVFLDIAVFVCEHFLIFCVSSDIRLIINYCNKFSVYILTIILRFIFYAFSLNFPCASLCHYDCWFVDYHHQYCWVVGELLIGFQDNISQNFVLLYCF